MKHLPVGAFLFIAGIRFAIAFMFTGNPYAALLAGVCFVVLRVLLSFTNNDY